MIYHKLKYNMWRGERISFLISGVGDEGGFAPDSGIAQIWNCYFGAGTYCTGLGYNTILKY